MAVHGTLGRPANEILLTGGLDLAQAPERLARIAQRMLRKNRLQPFHIGLRKRGPHFPGICPGEQRVNILQAVCVTAQFLFQFFDILDGGKACLALDGWVGRVRLGTGPVFPLRIARGKKQHFMGPTKRLLAVWRAAVLGQRGQQQNCAWIVEPGQIVKTILLPERKQRIRPGIAAVTEQNRQTVGQLLPESLAAGLEDCNRLAYLGGKRNR